MAFEFGVPGLPLAVPIEIRIDGERLARPWLEILGVYLEGGSTSDPVILEIFPVIYDGVTILFEISPEEAKRRLRGFAVASGTKPFTIGYVTFNLWHRHCVCGPHPFQSGNHRLTEE